jgi:hypothetical protein
VKITESFSVALEQLGERTLVAQVANQAIEHVLAAQPEGLQCHWIEDGKSIVLVNHNDSIMGVVDNRPQPICVFAFAPGGVDHGFGALQGLSNGDFAGEQGNIFDVPPGSFTSRFLPATD